MAARKVFTDKELDQMQADVDTPSATKTSVAKKWGIAPTTLNKRLLGHAEKAVRTEERKNLKKNKHLSEDEKSQIIKLYIDDSWSMNAIAKFLLRSAGAVKRALETANIPVRGRGRKKEQPITVGDVENPLAVGDKVFSFVYNSYAEVTRIIGSDGDTFRLWVSSDSHQFSAYQHRDKLALIPK